MNGSLVEINWSDNTSKKMKMRASKQEGGHEVLKMKKTPHTLFLTYCGDLSLRVLKIDQDKDNIPWKIIGYLCPYCLKVFGSHRGLFKEHMDVHFGPETCRSCKVGSELAIKNLFHFIVKCYTNDWMV